MQDQVVLKARQVTKTVDSPEGRLTILADVSLAVRAGETLAIVGASGAGKSTLLSLLAGLDSPSTGGVSIAGVELNELDEDGRARIRGRHVGFVFQSFHLIPSLTAVENIMLPLELRGRKDAREASMEALAQVGLGVRAAHYPKQLSGGEQQRVAIARASGRPIRGRAHGQSRHRDGPAHHGSSVRPEREIREHAHPGHPRPRVGGAVRPHPGTHRRPCMIRC
jgi:putative ABC transport system ATP-binding protein